MIKKVVIVLMCLMLVNITFSIASAMTENEEQKDNVYTVNSGFLCRLKFNGKTGMCFIRHFGFSRPVQLGIKWGFFQFSDAVIDIGKTHYEGDGIIFLSHYLGKSEYNQENEHWTYDGIVRACFVIGEE